MDYWKYLAHSQQGAERNNHRYYAREIVGSKGGRNVYRYFYSAAEYDSYRRSKGDHSGTSKKEDNSLIGKARKSHRENRWQPDTLISTGPYTYESYKNSAGKKRETEYRDWHAEGKVRDRFNRDAKKANSKKAKLLEAVYQADKKLSKTKVKVQKAGMDLKRNAKKGAATVSNLLKSRKKKSANTPASKVSNSKRIGEQHSADRKRAQKQKTAAKRAASKSSVSAQKRVMDNIRQRPYYQPKKV